MDRVEAQLTRGLWTLYEPVHAVTYFAPQAAEEFVRAGIRGFWRGYFAGRAAPLGAVTAAPVTALFSSFSPAMVERALPAVWEMTTPDTALRARAAGAATTIRSCATGAELPAVVEQLELLVEELPVAGRPLAAANSALARRDDLHERLWQAVTTLREWRGDGHIAALVSHGIAGLDILVLRCLVDIDRPAMQAARGWTEAEWELATNRLTDRGLISNNSITGLGHELLDAVEQTTDETSVLSSAQHMRRIGRMLRPISLACADLLPFPNPIGLVGAWDPDLDPDAQNIQRP